MGNFLSRLFGDGNSNKSRNNAITDTTHQQQRNTGVIKAPTVSSPQTVSQENLIATTAPYTETIAEEKSPKQNVRPKLEPFSSAKEPIIYTTTFETDIDAAPPHPLEEQLLLRDIDSDEIEIDTNLVTPEVEDAVIKIQAGIRGYLARKQIDEIKKDLESVNNEINAEKNNKQLELISDGNAPIVPPPPNFGNIKNEQKPEEKQKPIIAPTIDKTPENLPTKPIKIIETSKPIERSNVETKTQVIEKVAESAVEQQLVEAIFDDRKLLDNSQVVAIEIKKQDIINSDTRQQQQQHEHKPTSQQLINTASSTTVEVKPIKDSNEKVYKASVEQFGVLKRVQEPNSPPVITAMAMDSASLQFNIGLIPVIEEQREIEISSTHHSDNTGISADTPPLVVQEVLPTAAAALEIIIPQPPPSPQPIIQVEEQNGTILDAEEAATRIQAAFRGFQTRRTLSREPSPNRSSGSTTPVTPTPDYFQFRQTSDELFVVTSDTINTVQDDNNLKPLLLSEDNAQSVEESINTTLDRLEEHLLAQLITESNVDEEVDTKDENNAITDNSDSNNVKTESLDQIVVDQTTAIKKEKVETLPTVEQELETQPSVVTVDNNAQRVISIDSQLFSVTSSDQTLDSLNELAANDNTNATQTISEETVINDNINSNTITAVATEQSPDHTDVSQLPTGVDINLNTIVDNILVDENSNNTTTEQPIQQSLSYSSDEQTLVDVSVQQYDPIIQLTETQPQPQSEPPKTNLEILTDLVESWSLNSPPPPPSPIATTTTAEQILPQVIAQEDSQKLENESIIKFEGQPQENLIEISLDNSQKQPPQPQQQVSSVAPSEVSAPLWQESQIFTPKSSEETTVVPPPVNNVAVDIKPPVTPSTPTTEESKLHGILKQKSGQETPEIKTESPVLIRTELSTPETGPSTSEEISSPDDDPEFTGLSPNSPIPIRSSSPNPFGKKRRKPRKSGSRKGQ